MQSFISAFESAAETLVAASGALALAMALALVFERGRVCLVERPTGPPRADLPTAAHRRRSTGTMRHSGAWPRHRAGIVGCSPSSCSFQCTIAGTGRSSTARAQFWMAWTMPALIDRYLESWWWWRRAMALRAAGFLRMREYTPRLVAALDDGHAEIRAAALDGLADSEDPAALAAVVVRLHDETLHRGRRAAVLAAFGARCEPMLLDLAAVDPANR